MEAIILAGGRGTRLGALTESLPKPMVSVHEKPFLEILMSYWIQQGVKHFILSIGYKKESIQNHFGEKYKGVDVSYCVEEKPLGTGGAIAKSLNLLRSENPCFVMNGDTYFEVDSKKIQAVHGAVQASLTMALFEIDQPDRYESVELGGDGKIKAFVGRNQQGGYANGGVYLFTPLFLRSQNLSENKAHSLERDDLPEWVERNEAIYGYASASRFLDIGIPEDYQRAEMVIPSI